MLEIKALTAAYRQDFPILEGLDLTVPGRSSAGIIGRNGAGKSTLARAIMNMIPFTTGMINWNGLNLLERSSHKMRKSGIGYFIQDGKVFPSLSVEENLKISLFSTPGTDLYELIRTYHSFIPFMGSPAFLKSKAGNLSGGERNILALCMVMAGSPGLLILDEPFAGISPQNVQLMTALLEYRLSSTKATLLLIDQNKEIMARLCNSIYILKQNTLFPLAG